MDYQNPYRPRGRKAKIKVEKAWAYRVVFPVQGKVFSFLKHAPRFKNGIANDSFMRFKTSFKVKVASMQTFLVAGF